jgi:hypothetical protein
MIDYVEMYQRNIDSRYVPNLMRAARMSEQEAEEKIRELFPILREA